MASGVTFQRVGVQWPEGLSGNHIGFSGKKESAKKERRLEKDSC